MRVLRSSGPLLLAAAVCYGLTRIARVHEREQLRRAHGLGVAGG